MKTTLALCIPLLIICNTSCKKDSAAKNASHKLVAYTEDITAQGIGHVVETFNVNYDDQDRITSIISATKPGHRFVYQHTGNQFTLDKFADDKLTLHGIYFINSLSLVDSTWQYTNQRDTISFKYIYNNDKQLVKQKEYIHSYIMPAPVWVNTITYQYDLKGTLTKKTGGDYETSYRYDTACVNTVQTEPFYFPVQKQLPSHIFTTRFGTTTTIEHSYSFDGSQRLIRDKAVSSDGRVTVYTYTYQ